MAKYMDVHSGFTGATEDQLREAHQRDLEAEAAEGVHFERAWLDPDSGKCLSVDRAVDGGGTAGAREGRASGQRDLRATGQSTGPGLPGQGGEQLPAGGLVHRRAAAMLAEGCPCARDHVRVGVDLPGWADHAVDLPERAEGNRV